MSTNIGQIIYDLFGDNGDLGVLLCIFLIFLLDALLVPTLPELFFILGFMAGAEHNTPIVFGCELLLMAILAELGNTIPVLCGKAHKNPQKDRETR